jgi:hypothetical protein
MNASSDAQQSQDQEAIPIVSAQASQRQKLAPTEMEDVTERLGAFKFASDLTTIEFIKKHVALEVKKVEGSLIKLAHQLSSDAQDQIEARINSKLKRVIDEQHTDYIGRIRAAVADGERKILETSDSEIASWTERHDQFYEHATRDMGRLTDEVRSEAARCLREAEDMREELLQCREAVNDSLADMDQNVQAVYELVANLQRPQPTQSQSFIYHGFNIQQFLEDCLDAIKEWRKTACVTLFGLAVAWSVSASASVSVEMLNEHASMIQATVAHMFGAVVDLEMTPVEVNMVRILVAALFFALILFA